MKIKKLIPNVAVMFTDMCWPSEHSACVASYKARYEPQNLTDAEAMKLTTIADAYASIFSPYRTLAKSRELISNLRKACKNERCEFCENH